ncbi:lipocalin-like domain-containing protein [Acetobacter sp. TBRC 12305]|uniref:Lipocalin-like domain-containing protein n=1 Tax=Acetobacter garciniae TaxID=2817435 RepID=A0A939HMF9_9PROT|nr:lipocalin-like domain-containing protein [Acetobacter garciniae]MBO1324303.1 lipocalin-like domain-containing protein [Acetobacter garciniae]MBX0343992.1 lipocalin-like domain-containing protein [Acetobacter garciniae]
MSIQDVVQHSHAELENEELRAKLVGTWELVSYRVEEKESGSFINAMGPAPRGRVIFTPDGWVAFNLEGSNRHPATNDAERAHLMKTLVAYIGRYRVEGNQWITSVQTAWAPEWVGTEQRRTVTVSGDYADVLTPWRKMPNWAAGRLSRSIIRFRRAST